MWTGLSLPSEGPSLWVRWQVLCGSSTALVSWVALATGGTRVGAPELPALQGGDLMPDQIYLLTGRGTGLRTTRFSGKTRLQQERKTFNKIFLCLLVFLFRNQDL